MTHLHQTYQEAQKRLLDAISATEGACMKQVESAYALIEETLKNGKKIIACGNGGSASTAQHFTAELIGRYKNERRALPAISLTADTSAITAIGNDYGFEQIFARQLAGLGTEGDLLVAFSTSGRSPNVLHAIKQSVAMGIPCILLTGGKTIDDVTARNVSVHISVPVVETARIQEIHDFLIHIWCEALDVTIN